MRRWTRQVHTVSQDRKVTLSSSDNSQAGAAGNNVDQQYPELPMPKDSHLLPPQSRALLRAARAGYIYLRPAKHQDVEEEEKDLGDVDEPTAPVATKVERSFKERRWTQIPRHVEPPEIEYLAPRRPGLPSLYGAAGTANAVTSTGNQPMRKTKVQKVDPATGNIAIYDVWVPEGQTVEGEIKDESEAKPAHENATVTKMTPAPGTVVDGVGVANADGVVVAGPEATTPAVPKRRGPPPPKRRGKGFGGRGRKRVMFSREESTVSHGPDGTEDGRPEEEDEEQEEEGEGARTEDETSVSKGQEEVTPTPSVKTETEAPSAEKEAAPTETSTSTPAAVPAEQSNGVKHEETPGAEMLPPEAPPEIAPAPVADVAPDAMEGVEQTTTTDVPPPAPAPAALEAPEAPSATEQPAEAESLTAAPQPQPESEPQPSVVQPQPETEPQPQPPEISAPPTDSAPAPAPALVTEAPVSDPTQAATAAPSAPVHQEAEQTQESQQPQEQTQEQSEQQAEQQEHPPAQENEGTAADQPNTDNNNTNEPSASSS